MEGEKVIQVVTRIGPQCQHNKFILDDRLGYVKCGICGEHLNPMWVIEQYANHEHRLFQNISFLKRLAEEIKDKTRCKCEHCGEITRIANDREVSRSR